MSETFERGTCPDCGDEVLLEDSVGHCENCHAPEEEIEDQQISPEIGDFVEWLESEEVYLCAKEYHGCSYELVEYTEKELHQLLVRFTRYLNKGY